MARILCATDSLTGLVYSTLELTRRLQAAGHEVIYAGFECIRPMVEEQAVAFEPLDSGRFEAFLQSDAERSASERWRTLHHRRKQAVAAIQPHSFLDVLRRLEPELVLVDLELHPHIIAARAMGAPVALLNSFASIWRRPGLPPPHHLARPGVGWRGSRLGMQLLWWNLRLAKWRKAWSRWLRDAGCDRLSVLRQLASEVSFEFRHETDFGQWPIPFTYRRLPVLCLYAQELELPHRPPANAYYVGPMVLENRADHRITSTTRKALTTLFEQRRSKRNRKLIYAGFGSFFTTNHGLVDRLIEAVAERRDWDLVISLGGRDVADELGPLPANVHAHSWLPQTQILKHADATVSHGGSNTINESIHFGVPLLIYCGFETDMGGGASRIAHHRLGIVGDRSRDDAEAIRRHLERLLGEPEFHERVATMRAYHLAYAENRVAERVVEDLLCGAETSSRR